MTFESMKLNKQRSYTGHAQPPCKRGLTVCPSILRLSIGQVLQRRTDAMLYTPDPLNGVYNVNSLMSKRVRYITFHTALNEQNVNVTLDSLYSTSTINCSFIIPNFLLIERRPCLVQMIGQVNGDV